MTPHKHAEVLRQIADGVSIDEFEVIGTSHPQPTWMKLAFADFLTRPDFWEVRRKPQYIIVNGYKVPKPLDVMPVYSDVYAASPSSSSFYATGNSKYEWSRIQIARGILHSTPEAAIAHATAMLGIDPKWED